MSDKKNVIPRFTTGKFSRNDFINAIDSEGYAVVEQVLEDSFLSTMKTELLVAVEQEAKFHGSQQHKDYGMLLACPIYGGTFLQLPDNKRLMEPFDWILGDTSIIYVYTSSCMPPNATNYSARIHVDRPHFIPGYTEALGCLVMLDDFTEQNGATWVLPGSHLHPAMPDEHFFYNHAVRIVAPKGSVLYFHLRLWHAGGINTTDQWRHSVGIGMVRGYLKQRIDLPRALEKIDVSGVSDYGLQKLGFYAQPPASLEEFYAHSDKRTYKQKSEWEN